MTVTTKVNLEWKEQNKREKKVLYGPKGMGSQDSNAGDVSIQNIPRRINLNHQSPKCNTRAASCQQCNDAVLWHNRFGTYWVEIRNKESFDFHLLVHPPPVLQSHLTTKRLNHSTPTARTHLAAIFKGETLYQPIQEPACKEVTSSSGISCFCFSNGWNSDNLKDQHYSLLL